MPVIKSPSLVKIITWNFVWMLKLVSFYFQIPSHVDPISATYIEPFACSLHGVELANIQVSDNLFTFQRLLLLLLYYLVFERLFTKTSLTRLSHNLFASAFGSFLNTLYVLSFFTVERLLVFLLIKKLGFFKPIPQIFSIKNAVSDWSDSEIWH